MKIAMLLRVTGVPVAVGVLGVPCEPKVSAPSPTRTAVFLTDPAASATLLPSDRVRGGTATPIRPLTELTSADHPYLVFHEADVRPSGAIYEKILGTSPVAAAVSVWNAMPTLTSTVPSYISTENWGESNSQTILRMATQLAFRGMVFDPSNGTATTEAGNYRARAIEKLMSYLCTTTTAPYTLRTTNFQSIQTIGFRAVPFKYCGVVAGTALLYDWLYHDFTDAQRLVVRDFLLRCAICCIEGESSEQSSGYLKCYYQYHVAVNNYATCWANDIAIALMAVEPESDGVSVPSWVPTNDEHWSYVESNNGDPLRPGLYPGGTPPWPPQVCVSSGNYGQWPASPSTTRALHLPQFGDIGLQISKALDKIEGGWKDLVSPDGSVDEETSYASLTFMGLIPAYAALRNDFGSGTGWDLDQRDILPGTNIEGSARWMTRQLVAGRFPWTGDNSDQPPNGRGLNYDNRFHPVLYYLTTRYSQGDTLWGLDRIRTAYDVRRGYTTGNDSHGYGGGFCMEDVLGGVSARPIHCIFYPGATGPTAAAPRVLSARYRDNINTADGTSPHLSHPTEFSSLHAARFYSEFGASQHGGRFLLHNHADHHEMSVIYHVKDEWVNHGHEDGGHIGVYYDGAAHWVDRGRAVGGGTHGQNLDHNVLVLVSGGTPNAFGEGSAYDVPQRGSMGGYNVGPDANAAYLGDVRAHALAEGFDYVRGTHEYMWGWTFTTGSDKHIAPLAKAERTLLFLKHSTLPYLFLMDDVDGDGANSYTYRQQFWSTVTPTFGGSGSTPDLANPVKVIVGGKTLYSAWLVADGGMSASLNDTSVSNTAIWAPAAASGLDCPDPTGTDVTFRRSSVVNPSARADDFRLTLMTGIDTTVLTDSGLGSPATHTRGRKIVAPDGSTHLIAITRDVAQDISADVVKSSGKVFWARWSSSFALTDWVVAEGDYVTLDVPGGDLIYVLQSDFPCSASYRELSTTVRRLEVILEQPVAPDTGEIICWVPGALTGSEIFVSDPTGELTAGVDYTWYQVGNLVYIY